MVAKHAHHCLARENVGHAQPIMLQDLLSRRKIVLDVAFPCRHIDSICRFGCVQPHKAVLVGPVPTNCVAFVNDCNASRALGDARAKELQAGLASTQDGVLDTEHAHSCCCCCLCGMPRPAPLRLHNLKKLMTTGIRNVSDCKLAGLKRGDGAVEHLTCIQSQWLLEEEGCSYRRVQWLHRMARFHAPCCGLWRPHRGVDAHATAQCGALQMLLWTPRKAVPSVRDWLHNLLVPLLHGHI